MLVGMAVVTRSIDAGLLHVDSTSVRGIASGADTRDRSAPFSSSVAQGREED
jgi:hypothetical protein